MSSPVKLTEIELARELSKLPNWKAEGGKLHREYAFADFVAAFGFMASAALVAQVFREVEALRMARTSELRIRKGMDLPTASIHLPDPFA